MKLSRDPIDQKISLLHEEAEERDTQRRALKEKLPYIDLRKRPIDPALAEIVPLAVVKNAKAAPVALKNKRLAIALYTTLLPEAKELLRLLKERGFEVEVFITSLGSLNQVWSRYPTLHKTLESVVTETTLDEKTLEETKAKLKSIDNLSQVFNQITKNTPVTEILKNILTSALVLGVSDIHLEHITRDKSLLRFRVDGVLRDIAPLQPSLTTSITNRLKLLSKLKLNITDSPQDGRFTIQSSLSPIEVRTSIVPAEFGEAVVLRVLNPQVIALELSDLGLRADDEEIINRELKRPNGMILLTGPTGSGKTTTIYAFLKKIRTSAQKIITIEDPIEYHLEGIEQTQVDARSGYTFSTALPSILRQDPDIILVGEIRELQTAEAAIHAALTGHLVFSTLHTNNAAGAIPRLIDLGVKPPVIGPALLLVIAERLVRRLCPKCRREITLSELDKEKIQNFLSRLPKRVSPPKMGVGLYEAVGCDECSNGFKGQVGIFEILEIGTEIDALIKKEATEAEIDEVAKRQRMVSMQDDGLIKALSGLTTLSEVERMTGPVKW